MQREAAAVHVPSGELHTRSGGSHRLPLSPESRQAAAAAGMSLLPAAALSLQLLQLLLCARIQVLTGPNGTECFCVLFFTNVSSEFPQSQMESLKFESSEVFQSEA